ncbi:MAG: hypothetical protein R3288_13405 [Woeseiaceae bacterium]|nr:hypothetical protein [Woeseiaceae bacterium]
MKLQIFLGNLALLTSLSFAAAVQADDRKASVDAEFGAGFSHDSNVGIADIDNNSGSSDTARTLEAGISSKIPLANALNLRLGYDYSDTAYSELSEFDLGLHHGTVELGFEAAGFNTALTADRYVAYLDGDEYLAITQVTPNVSKLFGDSVYLRLAFTDASKEYDTLTTRDADNESLRVDAYWLIDGMDRYIAVGLQTAEEDALDDELDYDAFMSMLTLGQTLSALPLPVEFKAQLKLENRDYRNVTESIQALRRDDRLRASLSATIPLSDHFEVEGRIERSSTESNLDAADVDKMVYGLSLSASF